MLKEMEIGFSLKVPSSVLLAVVFSFALIGLATVVTRMCGDSHVYVSVYIYSTDDAFISFEGGVRQMLEPGAVHKDEAHARPSTHRLSQHGRRARGDARQAFVQARQQPFWLCRGGKFLIKQNTLRRTNYGGRVEVGGLETMRRYVGWVCVHTNGTD